MLNLRPSPCAVAQKHPTHPQGNSWATPRCCGSPSGCLWGHQETAEDTVGLGAAVNGAAPGRISVQGHLVTHGQAEHAAARVHLQDAVAVFVAEADHAQPILGDAQTQVAAGHHLVGEVVEPGNAAGELASLGAVGVLDRKSVV